MNKYEMHGKLEMNFKFDRDDNSLTHKDLRDNIVTQYYKRVDEAILFNMPDDFLDKLITQLYNERIRRQHES